VDPKGLSVIPRGEPEQGGDGGGLEFDASWMMNLNEIWRESVRQIQDFLENREQYAEEIDNYLTERFGENYQETIGNNLKEFIEAINYIDANITGGEGIISAGGIIIDKEGKVYPYIGFGFGGQPGISGTLTLSTQQVRPGWNVAIQSTMGIAAQAGFHSYSYPKGTFWELGVGAVSGNVTAIYIFKPVLDLW